MIFCTNQIDFKKLPFTKNGNAYYLKGPHNCSPIILPDGMPRLNQSCILYMNTQFCRNIGTSVPHSRSKTVYRVKYATKPFTMEVPTLVLGNKIEESLSLPLYHKDLYFVFPELKLHEVSYKGYRVRYYRYYGLVRLAQIKKSGGDWQLYSAKDGVDFTLLLEKLKNEVQQGSTDRNQL